MLETLKRLILLLIIFSGILFLAGCDRYSRYNGLNDVLTEQIIVIDAGHGGHDPGAEGYSSHYVEKEFTLSVSLKLNDLLNSKLKLVLF